MSKKTRLLALLFTLILTASAVGCGGKKNDPNVSETVSQGANGSGIINSETGSTSGEPAESDTGEGSTNTDPNNSNGTGTTGSNQTGSSVSTGGRVLEGNVYTSGFPIVKSPTTLRIMAEKETYHSDFNTMKFTQEYQKMTNVEIKWEFYATADRVTKRTLVMMSKDQPDVVCMVDSYSTVDIASYGSQGLMVELQDLIPKWAPNVQAAINKESSIKKAITTPENKIFSIPRVDSVPSSGLFPWKLYINKTWLSNLGLKVPTTYDELLAVLRAFKDGDPNGNGVKDEIPLVASGINPTLCGAPQGIDWCWTNDRMFVNNSGKVGYFMATEAYRESLRFYATLYKENLIDKTVMDGKAPPESKTVKGNVGMFIHGSGAGNVPDRSLKDYDLIAPIKANKNGAASTISTRRRDKDLPYAMVITAAAAKNGGEKVKIALRWIDYFFTPDGYIMENYGPATGGFYKKSTDGKIERLPGKVDTSRYQVAPGWVLPSWSTQAAKDKWSILPDSKLTVADKYSRDVDDKKAVQVYTPYMQKNMLPFLFFSKADGAWLSSNSEAIHAFAYNEGMQYIYGKKNIDTSWSDYLAELEKKGYKKLESIYQAAYNKIK